MTPKELARRIKRGEKWRLADFVDTVPNPGVVPLYRGTPWGTFGPGKREWRPNQNLQMPASEQWAENVRNGYLPKPLSWPDLTPAMREAELWREKSVTPMFEIDFDRLKYPGVITVETGAVVEHGDGSQKDSFGMLRGLLNALGLVAYAFAAAWLIALVVDMLRGGK